MEEDTGYMSDEELKHKYLDPNLAVVHENGQSFFVPINDSSSESSFQENNIDVLDVCTDILMSLQDKDKEMYTMFTKYLSTYDIALLLGFSDEL